MRECKERRLLFLLSPSHTCWFSHTFTQGEGRGARGAAFCRAILLVILSQRQGRAGATAVCLIACAVGVGSIIRPLCHPAAIPASSAPADYVPYFSREGWKKKKTATLINGGKNTREQDVAAAHKTQTWRRRKRRVDKREFVVGRGASRKLGLRFQPKETFKLIPAVAHVWANRERTSNQMPGRVVAAAAGQGKGSMLAQKQVSYMCNTHTHTHTHSQSLLAGAKCVLV